MATNHARRLEKLEGSSSGRQFFVWCDDESEVEATIAEMVKRKEIAASDRVHCVYWASAEAPAGSHERGLEDAHKP
jgi:hypothetical protein